MNTYRVCEKGENSTNLLAKSPFVISGHFHKKDHRTYKNGQILYLGSPYQHNFGDYGDDRGYYTIDLDSKSFDYYSNNFSPKFIKINKDNLTKKTIKDDLKNNFVHLSLDSSIKNEDVGKILTKLKSYNPNDIRIEYQNAEEEKTTEKSYDSIDILENIYEYVQTLDIECKNEVVNYLTEVYNNINK
jgi:DNA repair exonuclease SbcCD nuclease subunit